MLFRSGLVLSLEGKDLVIVVRETGERLRILDWGDSKKAQFAEFRFGDGTVWTIDDIKTKFPGLDDRDEDDVIEGTKDDDVLRGYGGNDKIYGKEGADVLEGGDGDDLLEGGDGNDTLTGGAGVDVLHGGKGNDIYIWKTGHGNDTIDDDYGDNVLELGDGVDPKNIKIGRDSRDLYLLIGETGEKIRIKDWYYKNQSQLSEIRFSDGTRWSRNDVNAMTPVLYSPEEGGTQTGFSTNDILVGGAGKDFLYGNAGNDTLEGKEGDDYLDGGRGDDTYVWNLGDGNDTIYDYYDSNVLNIGGGVDPNKAVISRDGRNLYLTISETGEKLTFKNWYYSSSYQLSEIRFADGATWTKDQINAMSPVLTSPAEGGTMTGYDTDDTLVGSANADSLYGNAGNDVLEGKKGDDYLDGGYGEIGRAHV